MNKSKLPPEHAFDFFRRTLQLVSPTILLTIALSFAAYTTPEDSFKYQLFILLIPISLMTVMAVIFFDLLIQNGKEGISITNKIFNWIFYILMFCFLAALIKYGLHSSAALYNNLFN